MLIAASRRTRSVWTAPATAPVANRMSRVSALMVCLPAADGDQHPVADGRVVETSAQRSALTSLRAHPPMKEPADHDGEAAVA